MKKIIISTLALALFSLSSCDTEFEQDISDIAVTSGEADFSKYVALGNSLTSGYRDNALYSSGQLESYPSMLAQQMALAGGGTFTQPLMPNDVGGFSNLVGFPGKLTLKVVSGALSPQASEAGGTLDNISGSGPYQNLGVPGAKSFHLGAAGYGNPAYLSLGKANPYFVRFASSANSSVMADALAQSPTFFSLWIGNNDVLSYATSGGLGVDQTGNLDPTTYGSNDITDPTVVASVISQYVNLLTANGAKGVIANIPDVSTIPFFTRIPYNTIDLTSAKAQALNSGLYQPLKSALTYLGQGNRINLVKEGYNPVLIVDRTLPNVSAQLTAVLTAAGLPATQASFIGSAFGQARQAKEGELILLTASNVLGKDAITNEAATDTSTFIYGVSFPVGDQYSLTSTELNNVSTAVAAYNASIKAIATSKGLAFVDANAKMQELATGSGIQWDGVKYTATFVTGGSFSLDGVHLTGRGYGIVANEFIKAINKTYKSNLPLVNPNQYSGVTFP